MIEKLKKESAELKAAIAKLKLEMICMQAEKEVLQEHAKRIKKRTRNLSHYPSKRNG